MGSKFLTFLVMAGMGTGLNAQEAESPADIVTESGQPAAVIEPVESKPVIPTVLIKQDTPIELMATKEVSTADVTAGTKFKLRVNKPVSVDGKVIIPVGATAHGEVIDAVDSGGLGKSGKMRTRLSHISLGDVEIPLEGEQSAKGTGAGSAGVAVIFTGLTGLFHRGNNAKIKAGELLNGFVATDVLLDVSGDTVKIAKKPIESEKIIAPPKEVIAEPAADDASGAEVPVESSE